MRLQQALLDLSRSASLSFSFTIEGYAVYIYMTVLRGCARSRQRDLVRGASFFEDV